ncbi:phosphoglucosamine mutase [SAR86 cluster bacterium]|nr:phosphoglucosamine mutase [SAR86 cluster bacterium]
MRDRKLIFFGTDGVRGSIDNEVNPESVLKLGHAAGRHFKKRGINTLVIGKDTRISGYMLESALQAGIISSGVNVRLVGPMPTPAISYLVSTFKGHAGVVISASHNSFEDNGIKFFDENGEKLSMENEREIEKFAEEAYEFVNPENLGKAARISDAKGRYIEFCKNTLSDDISFSGLTLVIDSANGAAYEVAPKVFKELGAEVYSIADSPNGLNINKDCGSTNIDFLKDEVLKKNADFGIALDGDGDRLIIIDSNGQELDGDDILYVIAKNKFESKIHLGVKGVVGTLMTNKGLEKAFNEEGIELVRSDVGDKYVLQKLNELNWTLGGEQSGHILCLDKSNTGDGIIAAIQFLQSIVVLNKTIPELLSEFKKYPQILTNVKVKDGNKVLKNKKLQKAQKKSEELLESFDGRVLIRKSGTEHKIRIMVESNSQEATLEQSVLLTDLVESIS